MSVKLKLDDVKNKHVKREIQNDAFRKSVCYTFSNHGDGFKRFHFSFRLTILHGNSS